MNDEFQCERCGSDCIIEGEYPRFECWCDNCKVEALGFDVLEYAADWYAKQIDCVADFKVER